MESTSPSSMLQVLRQEFVARGWTRKAPGRILLEPLLNLSLAAVGAIAYFAAPHFIVRASGLLLVVTASMGVGTNSHTYSNGATSDRQWLNELLTYFGFPFFLGLSATFWWHQHVAVHHTAPNVMGVDDDADIAPWFARTRGEIARSRRLRRFYYELLQWLALPFLLCMIGLNMQKTSWIHLARAHGDSRRRTRTHWFDLAALILHFVCLLVLPAILLGAKPAIVLYLLWLGLLGYLMFAVLAPGHFPSEAVCLEHRPATSDYFVLQTAATMNFRVGWIGGLVCSGLQYQIEPHLFPTISHVYYPRISVLVRDFCRRNGLPYRSYQWDHIIWKCVATFRKPPKTVPTLEDLLKPRRAA